MFLSTSTKVGLDFHWRKLTTAQNHYVRFSSEFWDWGLRFAATVQIQLKLAAARLEANTPTLQKRSGRATAFNQQPQIHQPFWSALEQDELGGSCNWSVCSQQKVNIIIATCSLISHLSASSRPTLEKHNRIAGAGCVYVFLPSTACVCERVDVWATTLPSITLHHRGLRGCGS